MSLDHRDNILQTLCPTVMVPRYSPLDPLHGPGHRFLAAADGLWLEVRRPWLRLVWPLCCQAEVKMPYGELEPSMEFSFDKVPEEFFRRFIKDAEDAHPIECSAWLVWNEEREWLEYRKLRTIAGTSASLNVERPPLLPHEHLAVDIHSHGGDIPAFFSPEDDRDDRGEVKIGVVVGNVNSETTNVVMRLSVLGLFIPL